MTDVSSRPRTAIPTSGAPATHSVPSGSGSARPLAVSTVLGALAIATAGLVVAVGLAVVGWLAAHDGTLGGATGVGVTGWLAGQGAPPRIASVPIGVVPLGVPVLVVIAARLTGRWALDTSAPASHLHAGCALGAAGLTYGTVAATLAVAAVPPGVVVDPVRAGALAALLVAAGVAIGLAPGLGWTARGALLLPPPVLAAIRGALTGLATLLGLAGAALLAMLAVHGSDVLALGRRLEPGLVGGSLLVVVSLLVAPNLVLWSAAYLLGPGFAVGTATVVSPSGVVLGTLPAYPPLAALPPAGDPPGWVALLLVLPAAAGVVAGAGAERRDSRPGAGPWWRTAVTGAGAGVLAGAVLAVLLLVAGGGVGPGRLADTGPLPPSGLLALGSLGLGGLLGALASRALGDRATMAARLPRLPGWGRLPRLTRAPRNR